MTPRGQARRIALLEERVAALEARVMLLEYPTTRQPVTISHDHTGACDFLDREVNRRRKPGSDT